MQFKKEVRFSMEDLQRAEGATGMCCWNQNDLSSHIILVFSGKFNSNETRTLESRAEDAPGCTPTPLKPEG